MIQPFVVESLLWPNSDSLPEAWERVGVVNAEGPGAAIAIVAKTRTPHRAIAVGDIYAHYPEDPEKRPPLTVDLAVAAEGGEWLYGDAAMARLEAATMAKRQVASEEHGERQRITTEGARSGPPRDLERAEPAEVVSIMELRARRLMREAEEDPWCPPPIPPQRPPDRAS